MCNNRQKICIVATLPLPLIMFMMPHITMLSKYYDVTLISNGSEQDFPNLFNENVQFISVDIARKVSLWLDILALFKLYKIFRSKRFVVVHSIMPKTALLAMLAAFVARVPNRIHTFTGQVWANKEGATLLVLKMLDRIVANCATGLITDSFSQRKFLITQHIVDKNKIVVLGNGSVCGVDTQRFNPNFTVGNEIRTKLGIPNNDIIYLFLGRLNKDKGILDLALAFTKLAINMPHVHLLVVGPDEEGMDVMLKSVLAKCLRQFHRIGFTNKPEDYMASANIFCLPSYREGFGSVLIEAASVGLPAVASRIYGITDAVVDGETGILHQPKNIEEIKRALLRLTIDTNLRQKMSKQAIVRAHKYFSSKIVVAAMHDYYQKLLNKKINLK